MLDCRKHPWQRVYVQLIGLRGSVLVEISDMRTDRYLPWQETRWYLAALYQSYRESHQ